jgi:predicted RNA-binding Zn-ribbon protein involved in translation (DUF1610 family)
MPWHVTNGSPLKFLQYYRLVSAHSLEERLFFNCPACGLKLVVVRQQAGVSGPCPTCGAWVKAPDLSSESLPSSAQTSPLTMDPNPHHQQPATRPRRDSSTARKGRISADLGLDHQHLELRETTKTLWMIVLFVLAVIVYLLINWFLTDWVKN